jgi:large subunit ribosomal protein L30
MSEKRLRVQYVKSAIGYSQSQKGTIRALGFRRLGDVIEVADNQTMRGMLRKVEHLVEVAEVDSLPSDRTSAGLEGSEHEAA